MNGSKNGSLSGVPNGRIIDFETAELRTVPFQDSLYLWVRGQLPAGGLEAKLAPRIYHETPDYWGIEVIVMNALEPANDREDVDADPGFPTLTFERSVPLTGITGFRGIAVIGANLVKRIEISGESF